MRELRWALRRGALLSVYFGTGVIVFTVGVFVLGLLSGMLHVDRSAYRFAGITVSVVMLIPSAAAPWVIGLHRFTEVSLWDYCRETAGDATVWPERAGGRKFRARRF